MDCRLLRPTTPSFTASVFARDFEVLILLEIKLQFEIKFKLLQFVDPPRGIVL